MVFTWHGIGEVFQSCFKALHSKEPALLRVFNDLIVMVNSGESALFVFLELTAVFDTVDHSNQISHLEHCVGMKVQALERFRS